MEYRAVAMAAQECSWLIQLLKDLHQPIEYAMRLFCDNMSAKHFGRESGESTKLDVRVVVLGVFLIVLIGMALYRVVISKKRKKDDQAKIERFLEDYEAHKSARISYANIKRFTNQFRDQLGQGIYGTLFKGKLSDDIHIAVKILNNDSEGGEGFINEVGIISTIHHVNSVRLVGYCTVGFRRTLVNEFLPNNSLEKFEYSKSHKNNSLDGSRWNILLGNNQRN
ncbi:hypothetical protein RJ639_004877 [Escallonia herrerae]|uniref:Protein kinase domain-containing protein n=1 Tax=Escallonia herrerae TaxID=1293975 RepID=A0AA88W4X9_9ASTE|nr:hypothetical protein RJ639_004877 [Escallonia herrerae]